MALLYFPKDSNLGLRNAWDPSYQELTIACNPNMVFYFDTASAITAASASLLYITASWAQTASVTILFASNSLSASYAGSSSFLTDPSIKITASVITSNAYQVSSTSFANIYTSSFILSNIDDGKFVIMVSGSTATVAISGSLISSTFNSIFYQSGSGRILFATSSGTTLRQRQGYIGSAGQYAIMSLLRGPNGDFVLGGDVS